MKHIKTILLSLSIFPLFLASQETETDTIPNIPIDSVLVGFQEIEEEKTPDKPERPAFESSFIIDNPTNVLFGKKSMEMQIKHRFGVVNSGNNDLFGIWAPGNIHIGLSYAFFNGLTVGFNTVKFNRMQDFNMKLSLLRQTRSGKVPFSISYYGNFVIDARKAELFNTDSDRFSFFHQVSIARRFSPNFSLQVAPNVSHFNLVEPGLENDVFGLSVGGRIKISPQTAILFDYSQPFTNYAELDGVDINPKPGASLGIEFSTAGHAFQLLISNYDGIVPQRNYVFNQNDFFKGDILIGFNITRLYKF
ncbi:MAG: DUF5777 family beta-barrel protein [Flavobacteriaceae bacterium]